MKLLSGFFIIAGVVLMSVGNVEAVEESRAVRYVRAVERFADTVVDHGRDKYGDRHTPLFVDGLEVDSLEPVVWKKGGQSWVLCNFASQQPLVRLLDGLTALTSEAKYRKAAEEATGYALKNLQSPSGLLYWGGHLAWDLQEERPVGQYAGTHEMKNHGPYYRFMWKVDREATGRLMEAVWGGHVLDWGLLDYNRHADVRKPVTAKWDAGFDEAIEVPFATDGGNLSFANVTPSLMHASTMLAVLAEHEKALMWTRRLGLRWQQGKHPKTGLCGGQLSYRKNDRAKDALGHVHAGINEAKIVASYHQTSRYHNVPLAQMQGGEALIAAGGEYAAVGRELVGWAMEDLFIYGRECYDEETEKFTAKMIDGTALEWRKAKTGYYVPESFAPRGADGALVWGYATACRLGKDDGHWQILRRLLKGRGLGDIGESDGRGRKVNLDTSCADWRVVYCMLELYRATGDWAMLDLACRIGDNLLKMQAPTGLFGRQGRRYARTGDEIPLALLHLAAAIQGKTSVMPRPAFDGRFFHCEYHGELEEHQKKRADARTYDNNVFYGPS